MNNQRLTRQSIFLKFKIYAYQYFFFYLLYLQHIQKKQN